jgi:hypothetical protein
MKWVVSFSILSLWKTSGPSRRVGEDAVAATASTRCRMRVRAPRERTGAVSRRYRSTQCPYAYYEYIYGEYRSNPELQSLYQKYPRTSSMFRSVDRVKLIMSILKCDPNENGAGLVLEKLLKAEIILAAFPLHDRSELQACQAKWLVYWSWPYVSRRPRIAFK